jgi:hypothetical protein
MIRTAPRTDVSLSALALAALMVAGLGAGFVAGQVAPDVIGALAGTTVVDDTPALTQNADFGIRHLAVTVPLSEVDDYGIRIISAPPLSPGDDYGIRHLPTVPLTPNDDYGIRHQGDQP